MASGALGALKNWMLKPLILCGAVGYELLWYPGGLIGAVIGLAFSVVTFLPFGLGYCIYRGCTHTPSRQISTSPSRHSRDQDPYDVRGGINSVLAMAQEDKQKRELLEKLKSDIKGELSPLINGMNISAIERLCAREGNAAAQ